MYLNYAQWCFMVLLQDINLTLTTKHNVWTCYCTEHPKKSNYKFILSWSNMLNNYLHVWFLTFSRCFYPIRRTEAVKSTIGQQYTSAMTSNDLRMIFYLCNFGETNLSTALVCQQIKNHLWDLDKFFTPKETTEA